MIPTLILIGVAFGRWWRVVLAMATLGWPLVLLGSGTLESDPVAAVAAAGLAIANTVGGVLVYQAGRWLIVRLSRSLRRQEVRP